MTNDPHNKEQCWEVAGLYFKTLTKDEALKYAQEFFASHGGSETDIRSLTLADVKPWVAPQSETQSIERLRQWNEINAALTLWEGRFRQLETIAFNLRLTDASAEELAAIELEREGLRIKHRELGARMQAWIREGNVRLA